MTALATGMHRHGSHLIEPCLVLDQLPFFLSLSELLSKHLAHVYYFLSGIL